ncbi:salivary glue protein Sgs-3-like [Papilio machaon]|uniref:salivary glue protein Sgs-3-like n=1 Tax=Papilio machaon TaxID=76193 RepID=UPI001E665F02|nr:salivary glue protein Sgs-3-like [Papilio machaon]
MFKKTLFSILLLALAMHSVNGKPACGCASSRAPPASSPPPSSPPPCQPATPEPCVAKQETTTSTTSNPCVTTAAPRVPCIEQKIPSTTTTTTTTPAPTTSTTTTTVAPSTSTAAPKTDCSNGDIYPISVGGCNQFLMCNNRVYILMVCPSGLGFNFQTKTCERSDNVPACSAHS